MMPEANSLAAHRAGMPFPDEQKYHDWIFHKTGLTLHSHQMPVFRDCVLAACEHFACAGPAAFFQRLMTQEASSPEMEYLISGITVGETYFYRIPEQITFLREVWIPEIVHRKRASGDLGLRIWSAGCSGGEELYTLAMMLAEAIPDIAHWNLHLLGSDLNNASIQKAREGIYSAWSLRVTEEAQIARHFQREAARFLLRPEIRRMAQFMRLNLVADSFPSLASGTYAMDLIFCRNVFIYFTPDIVRRVMAKFQECLAPAGTLLLAPADIIEHAYTGLDYVEHGNVFYFKRAGSTAAEKRPLPSPAPAPAFSEFRGQSLPAITLPPPQTDDIVALIAQHQWNDALLACDMAIAQHGGDARLHRLQAEALAACGRVDAALAACEASLRYDALDARSYQLRALLALENNQLQIAETSFAKVLYLDWNWPECHFQMALLKLRQGRHKAARKHLDDALDCALRMPADAPLRDTSGLSFGRLVEILRGEIEVFGGTVHHATRGVLA